MLFPVDLGLRDESPFPVSRLRGSAGPRTGRDEPGTPTTRYLVPGSTRSREGAGTGVE